MSRPDPQVLAGVGHGVDLRVEELLGAADLMLGFQAQPGLPLLDRGQVVVDHEHAVEQAHRGSRRLDRVVGPTRPARRHDGHVHRVIAGPFRADPRDVVEMGVHDRHGEVAAVDVGRHVHPHRARLVQFEVRRAVQRVMAGQHGTGGRGRQGGQDQPVPQLSSAEQEVGALTYELHPRAHEQVGPQRPTTGQIRVSGAHLGRGQIDTEV